ncbi:unnamed protein product [Haemonchus placei]|uniref:Reverse transcriptase domain-containing protein n=1 Tax=Haemonchus placei TaxID=6290 RepID=A0A3P8CKG4_HAEPC|nr:unnamed protein product [Haemonchus placei]
MWNFLDVPHPRHTLPSGLQLVPSKLGYLLTGQQMRAPQEEQGDRTDRVEATLVNSFTNFDEELERWDKYWTMDSAGVCEFTGTKNAEKDATNAKVAKFFEEMIEKREDGYYIRFPYKENHPPLPTNKAIALKRLKTVLETLRRTPELLNDYDKTFRAQQEIGVIEEVENPSHTDGAIVHYIPHQPVITPQKETTKLRIVFDASAHSKGSPSLNDVLHQGPLILPELYAMLLRFRTPKYVIISDVEKVFLQVRLHGADRDATRFLWVRDINEPFGIHNVATFRFTRVTFGLNVSPYLLGATINHHLQSAMQNEELAKEIRENLYVDNLILSAATPSEAARKSLEARKIFEEMGTNLREFLSNDETLRQQLPENACAKSLVQKVLGITWNSETDRLEVRCSLTVSDPITKRSVARQIASIYDPMGWLVPLLVPAKKFQQDLWREEFDWDTKLPPEVASRWIEILENQSIKINGFQKSLPRRYCTDLSELTLAVFADASEVAIAACAYLFSECNSSLMIAKSKLSSIKTKTTMPKLEMNALTIATRLAFSAAQALKLHELERSTIIYIFSD